MLTIAIPYFSGYGHTEAVARCVAEGVTQAGLEVSLLPVTAMDEASWAMLDKADAIIFGCPTYMGGVPAEYKAFMDASSRRWQAQSWRDKLAAGFINAGSAGGDNLNTMYHLCIFAMQHSMLWVGSGLMPMQEEAYQINRLGGFMGLLTQSENAPPDITPPEDDRETARRFGMRVAQTLKRIASTA